MLMMLGEIKVKEYTKVLKDLYIDEYREVQEIYDLLPESQWKSYIELGVEDHREQILLEQALKNLKAAFLKKVLHED